MSLYIASETRVSDRLLKRFFVVSDTISISSWCCVFFLCGELSLIQIPNMPKLSMSFFLFNHNKFIEELETSFVNRSSVMNVQPCILQVNRTSISTTETAEDIESFSKYLLILWARVVEEGTICVWLNCDGRETRRSYTDRLLISGRKQLLPHEPFAGMVPHRKVISRQGLPKKTPRSKIKIRLVFSWVLHSLERTQFIQLSNIVEGQRILKENVGQVYSSLRPLWALVNGVKW